MPKSPFWLVFAVLLWRSLLAAGAEPEVPRDPLQNLERTCFQTSHAYSDAADLRSDVAIVYGIDRRLPERIQSWREHGYRVHVMTGAAWGNYREYLDGRFDGASHDDEAQTDRDGNKILHNRDIPYMCPTEGYGKFLCAGVQRALDAGAEAIHLEEPEFWVRAGYSKAFQKEWRSYYGEDWQSPETSVDAQWRSAKLKYYLYRRTLQQIFNYVQDYNRRTGRHVRCYVPTHSLLNYAQWHIVSPESSLARLAGCDGYIAQVWTGTARTPNVFRGQLRERTFETAFLEYGAAQNLVRATGRTVWYLNDPVEDNPRHSWDDYRRNWESTLTASLLQPEVWRYEVSPWPERVFAGHYPAAGNPEVREPIPPAYATEVQTVINSLNDMNQPAVAWDCGTAGIGLLVSDSLMFERGEPGSSDLHLSNVYGLALPLLKRGMPIAPVQLENVTVPNYLDGFRVLLLSYHGMKPLDPRVHAPLVDWVKHGGVLIVCDDDGDPYNRVHEWWNSDENRRGPSTTSPSPLTGEGRPAVSLSNGGEGVAEKKGTVPLSVGGSRKGYNYATPREHLFEQFGLNATEAASLQEGKLATVGNGRVIWLREDPAGLAASAKGEARLIETVKKAAASASIAWRETNFLLLRRGPYVIAAGLDESIGGETKLLLGRWINLFDPELRVQETIELAPGSRYFLRDLMATKVAAPQLLASACKAVPREGDGASFTLTVEGVGDTPAIVLLHSPKEPRSITLAGQPLDSKSFKYSSGDHLLWIRFANQAKPRELVVLY